MKIKVFAGICLAIIVIGGIAGGLYYINNYEAVYYSQVDNTQVSQLSSSDSEDLKYEYVLDCYNDNGKRKSLKFKTHKILKDKAYLSLEVRSLGVHKWAEVQFDELPKKVQEKLKN